MYGKPEQFTLKDFILIILIVLVVSSIVYLGVNTINYPENSTRMVDKDVKTNQVVNHELDNKSDLDNNY